MPSSTIIGLPAGFTNLRKDSAVREISTWCLAPEVAQNVYGALLVSQPGAGVVFGNGAVEGLAALTAVKFRVAASRLDRFRRGSRPALQMPDTHLPFFALLIAGALPGLLVFDSDGFGAHGDSSMTVGCGSLVVSCRKKSFPVCCQHASVESWQPTFPGGHPTRPHQNTETGDNVQPATHNPQPTASIIHFHQAQTLGWGGRPG